MPYTATGPLWSDASLHLVGLGSYLPRGQHENPAVEGPATGNAVEQAVLGAISVRTRYVADEDETIPVMAAAAGQRALRDAGVAPAEVDLVVLSNWTTPAYTPDHAPEAAARMGAPHAFAFDVATACLGFIHAVQLAAMYLTSTSARIAVVTCAEHFSRRVRPGSKGALVCSDAAGAVVLRRLEGRGPGLLDTAVLSDGNRADVIVARPPQGHVRSQPSLPEHAVASIQAACSLVLERNNLSISDVDWVVPHPGTDVVHRRVQEALAIPNEKFVVNLASVGNTSSASIPLALDEHRRAGGLQAGELVLSPAIGAGWYYGAMLYVVS